MCLPEFDERQAATQSAIFTKTILNICNTKWRMAKTNTRAGGAQLENKYDS